MIVPELEMLLELTVMPPVEVIPTPLLTLTAPALAFKVTTSPEATWNVWL